jgi:hypothetical protein
MFDRSSVRTRRRAVGGQLPVDGESGSPAHHRRSGRAGQGPCGVTTPGERRGRTLTAFDALLDRLGATRGAARRSCATRGLSPFTTQPIPWSSPRLLEADVEPADPHEVSEARGPQVSMASVAIPNSRAIAETAETCSPAWATRLGARSPGAHALQAFIADLLARVDMTAPAAPRRKGSPTAGRTRDDRRQPDGPDRQDLVFTLLRRQMAPMRASRVFIAATASATRLRRPRPRPPQEPRVRRRHLPPQQ